MGWGGGGDKGHHLGQDQGLGMRSRELAVTRWYSLHWSHQWTSYSCAASLQHWRPAWPPAEQHWGGVQEVEATTEKRQHRTVLWGGNMWPWCHFNLNVITIISINKDIHFNYQININPGFSTGNKFFHQDFYLLWLLCSEPSLPQVYFKCWFNTFIYTTGGNKIRELLVRKLTDNFWANENAGRWVLTGMLTVLPAVKRAPASKPPSTITVEPGGYTAPMG